MYLCADWEILYCCAHWEILYFCAHWEMPQFRLLNRGGSQCTRLGPCLSIKDWRWKHNSHHFIIKYATYSQVVGSQKKVTTAHSPYLLTKKNGRGPKCWVLHCTRNHSGRWSVLSTISSVVKEILFQLLSQEMLAWWPTRMTCDAPLLGWKYLCNAYIYLYIHNSVNKSLYLELISFHLKL